MLNARSLPFVECFSANGVKSSGNDKFPAKKQTDRFVELHGLQGVKATWVRGLQTVCRYANETARGLQGKRVNCRWGQGWGSPSKIA